MMTMLFCFMSMLISLNFLFMNHPLAMGLTLLVQTLLISVSAGLTLPSFWFSYVLFLVFLGGMLVLFIYVASLASNELFSFSPSLGTWTAAAITLSLGVIMITDPLLINSTLEFLNIDSISNMTSAYPTFVFKMYHSTNYIFTLLMIIYLLLTLVIVANIVTAQEGPLRPMT